MIIRIWLEKKLLAGSVLILLLAVATLAHADMDSASDLREDGITSRFTGKPIVALVSASDCSYCELVKENVFVGMERDERIILRELSIDSSLALVDFEGNRTTHQDYADSRRLRFTPTVLFLDGAGSPLAEPLVGVTTIDFYGFYLNRSIAHSIEALKQQAGVESN